MRTLAIAALLASGLLASMPAAAQVSGPGPVYYNSAPGTGAPQPPVVYDPAGPTYYNQSGAPIPGAPTGVVSANPPFIPGPNATYRTGGPLIAGPPAMSSPNPPYYNTPPHRGGRNGGRWGGMNNGRWWGGMQAPGGWGSYRRPSRGHSLPNYWMQSNFRIPDYYSFGLRQPGNGYFWVRYYDDAVLVDGGGRVWDSVSGIAWAEAEADAGYGYASSAASASAGGSIAPVDPNNYYEYPRGGYAPPAVGAPPAVQYYPACPQQCPNGGTVYYRDGGVGYDNGGAVYRDGGPGYNGGSTTYYGGGGGYYGGGTTTTVVIQGAPIVTTTTTETIEETTTYVTTPRRVVRRAWRPRPKPRPRPCGCGCCR
jgi:Ni/Co efflux regulator RcnB